MLQEKKNELEEMQLDVANEIEVAELRVSQSKARDPHDCNCVMDSLLASYTDDLDGIVIGLAIAFRHSGGDAILLEDLCHAVMARNQRREVFAQ